MKNESASLNFCLLFGILSPEFWFVHQRHTDKYIYFNQINYKDLLYLEAISFCNEFD